MPTSYKSVDDLREMVVGERIPAAVMNAIIRGVKEAIFGEDGFRDGGGQAFRTKDRARQAFPIVAEALEEIPIHAVVGIAGGAESGVPCRVVADKVSPASPLGLFTNDKVVAPAGSQILLRPINDYDVVLVEVTGELPDVGEPCGPDLGTWGVTAGMPGLMCLSEPVDGIGGSGSGAGTYIWVMKVSEPIVMLGLVAVEPGSGSGDLSSGVFSVHYRNGDDLIPAQDPVTGAPPWLLPFWVVSGETLSSGDTIRVGSTVGVGLVYLAASGGGDVLIGVLMEDLNAEGSGLVAELDLNDANQKIYTGRTYDVWDMMLNRFQMIESGVIVNFVPMSDGRYRWISAHCEISNVLPSSGAP